MSAGFLHAMNMEALGGFVQFAACMPLRQAACNRRRAPDVFALVDAAELVMQGSQRRFVFSGAAAGPWIVDRASTLCGEPLAPASHLAIDAGTLVRSDAVWALTGVTSNMRYTTRQEATALAAKQAGLARPEATRAALIPIRKNQAWWAMTQDERRAIYEEHSRHTTIGLEYLPRIARRLHHCRDLGEPFDFLTWFEFAPEHEPAFDELLVRMRASEEWAYVDREIDIRLRRA